ncbi:MAG: ABC transporter [Kangiellaceae bacterium]|jgi:ABC-type uncharacterized transport system involved in gliding motility auxiliary subunit|nr:ABC transporter [Kangiellaceae bacterium]|tara:strand:+ start:3979 stop:5838 length:1860 start_codon:yes stop_codon:yes gene_type:complete
MKKTLFSASGLAVLAIGFLAFNLLVSIIFGGVRLDLTENRLYTISDSSRQVLESIDEPVNLYFFFSDKASRDLPQIRSYATRVRELLEEYEQIADGKINLTLVDPEPFSEAEDQAAEFGLQGVPLSNGESTLYLGLAGTNSIDDQEIIPFFQPGKENFLEADISKMIYRLANTKKPVLGVMSNLKIAGNNDYSQGGMAEPWMSYNQLSQLYEIRSISVDEDHIDDDIDLLLVVQPTDITEPGLYAIDQFVLRGGKLALFVDPVAEMDRPAQPGMPSPTLDNQKLAPLFKAWGVEVNLEQVVADMQHALAIGRPNGGGAVTHLGLMGLPKEAINQEETISADLETINLASAGYVVPLDNATTAFTSLITTSQNSMLFDRSRFQMLMDPEPLLKEFNADAESYTVAARLKGAVKSAFDKPPVEGREDTHLTEAEDINVVIVTDSDVLSDRLWVQVQNFFGQSIATPFADNASLLLNIADTMSGSSALIGLRSRGQFARPFHTVNALRKEAEQTFRETEQQLQGQLDELEQKLIALQKDNDQQNALILNDAQQNELAKFQQQKLEVRKELRDVRHKLDKDIEALGSVLKFMNIALVPIILCIIAIFVSLGRRKKMRAAVGSV